MKPPRIHVKEDFVNIPVNLFLLPEKVEVLGKTWVRKNEFHISVFDPSQVAEQLGAPIEKVRKFSAQAASDITIGSIGFTGEVRLAKLEKRQSIVLMCTVSGLDSFYQRFSQLADTLLAAAPTHVTIYTTEGGRGIWIRDEEELNSRTQLLNDDEAAVVKQAINFDSIQQA